ncbi:hypothetical protein [Lacisediminimonas profundi]|uniref:hypothetical protein n=1 Tax=Lacisediminimonas profundi TaxID=2603856 RepID=UPI00124B83F7|nr:hypothetical protein [Lacisediminimonas profundi]
MSKKSKAKLAAERKAKAAAQAPVLASATPPAPAIQEPVTTTVHDAYLSAQHAMPTYQGRVAVTGLPGLALDRLCGMLQAITVDSFAEDQWRAPVLTHAAALSEIEAVLKEQEGVQVLAMYESPWDAVLAVSEEQLSEYLDVWMRYHSGLLRLRQESGGRLILVSARRLDDSAALLFDEVRSICGHAPEYASELDGADHTPDGMAALRAKNFEWIAPEYWDVYEALESCSWLGNGEPEYRDNLSVIDSIDLAEVAADWHRALHLPRLLGERNAQLIAQGEITANTEAELQEARTLADEIRQQVSHLQSQYDDAQEGIRRLTVEAHASTENHENETRHLQEKLARLDEALQDSMRERGLLEQSLEKQASAAQQREVELQSLMVTQSEAAQKREQELQESSRKQTESAQARVQELEAALHAQSEASRKIERDLQERLRAAEEVAKENASEADLLLAQLHQVQESLESTFIQGQEAAKQAGDVRARLEQEKAALTEQVKKLQGEVTKAGDASKALAVEKAALAEQVKKLQGDATKAGEASKALAAEKAALTEQVKKLQTEITKVEQAAKALAAEKAAASGQVEKLQAEIARSAEAAKALTAEKSALAAQVSKVQGEVATALQQARAADTALKAKVDAAIVQEQGLKAQIVKLESRIKEAESQVAQVSDKLKVATADAEKQSAALQAEKAKLAAEVTRLTNELSNAAAKSKAIETELQQRAKAEAEQEAKLRESIATIETRAKEAESEADLLLQQLHQVQEELEHYFVRGQDVTKALENSTDSFNRARRVVAQLIKVQAA